MVVENLPNTTFRVKITETGESEMMDRQILCHLSGKMRINWVRLLPGDRVRLQVSRLDNSKGRITIKIK